MYIHDYRNRLGAKVECERNEMIIEKEIFQTKVLEQQKQ